MQRKFISITSWSICLSHTIDQESSIIDWQVLLVIDAFNVVIYDQVDQINLIISKKVSMNEMIENINSNF